MASENLKIDENTRWVLGAITNDGSMFIKNLRVNPTTGRLLCDAHVTSSNTSIGDTIPGGTEGSVLFIGPGSTLAQDNAEFFWDDTDHYLGLGTDTPAATLHVVGSVEFDLGGDATGDIFYRDSGGQIINLPIGTSGQILSVSGGVPAWENSSSVSAYTLIQNQGVSVTQETTINLTNLLTASDVGGKTQLTINVANLAANNTFVADLVANATFISDLTGNSTFQSDVATFLLADSTFLTDLGTNSTFITALTGDATFQSDVITFINSSGSLSVNLTSQVTGILPIANGGTNSSTQTGAFDNLSPLTTKGDIIVYNGTHNVRLGVGTDGYVLTANSGASDGVDWEAVTASVAYTSGVVTTVVSAPTVIAHGLGKTPSFIKLTAFGPGSGTNTVPIQSTGTYDGTNTATIYIYNDSSGLSAHTIDTTYAVYISNQQAGGHESKGAATFDATDITITWTNINAGYSSSLLWEAYG